MRLSTALSALAGGLVLGWAAMAAADPPPPAPAPPAVPIFYCPVGAAAPAAATPASHPAPTHSGAGCPTGRTVATDTHHHVLRHTQIALAIHRPTEREQWVEEHRDGGAGHMFMYRYNDAMDDMQPSCPHRGHPCPPEPRWGHLDGPGSDGGYAEMTPPPMPYAPPPCPRVHHTCPQAPAPGVFAEVPPAPAPPHQDFRPPCPRVHHDCPQAPQYNGAYAQAMPPLQRPAPHYDDHFAQMTPPAMPPCPRAHHDCPQPPRYDDGYAQATPPAPQPSGGWWRSHHGSDGAYAQMTPPPAPPVAPPVRVPPPVRIPPPAYGFEQRQDGASEHQGYAYERRETEQSSGWSYSEQDGHGQYQHWSDHDGAHPPPPRQPCPPNPDHGCAYADGQGQWSDGSYGQVYPVAGRDAHGYLVWPGKTPQP